MRGRCSHVRGEQLAKPMATSLLAWELRRHPQLEIRSNRARRILATARFQAGQRSRSGPSSRSCCRLPMPSADQIGTVALSMPRGPRTADAAKIAADISRHVYAASGLAEARSVRRWVRSAPRKPSDLIERGAQREPSLVTIAFHVALPGRDNQIVASNFGRIGKPADADDRRVIATSTVLQEVTNEGKRFAVELPLRDHSGRTIGALSTSFMGTPGGQQAAYKSAQRVQQDLARSIPHLESLAG